MKLRFVSDKSAKEVLFPVRDFGVLQGPSLFVEHGSDLIRALGVFESFSVALGRPMKSEVVRPRSLLAALVSQVLASVRRDSDLLSFDYKYSFSSPPTVPGHTTKPRAGGHHGFRIGNLFGGVDTRPNGFCTVRLLSVAPSREGRIAQIIDLRVMECLPTDDWGLLKCHRRSARLHLPAILSDLSEFLEQQVSEEIRIQNRW